VSTSDDDTELEFFEEPATLESPERQRRRMRPSRPGGPRRPSPPPPGAVALGRLAGFVALAIAVVVGLVFWVGSCQGKSKHDEYASYMNSLRPIAQTSAGTGAAFANELGSAKLTLPGLQSKLDQWSRQQQTLYNDAVRLQPPASLQAPQQAVLSTLQLRAIGLAGLANTVAGSGSKSPTKVADLLAKQAQLLTASDLVWANLFRLPATETMRREGVIGVIAPPSQIVSNPDVISPRSFGIVYARLKSTNTGGKVTGLHGSELNKTEAVSGSSVKELSTSTPTTVDVSASLAFKVTFTNAGNFQEVKVPVTLTVSGIGKQSVSKRKLVPSILSGKSATVTFANLNLPTAAFGASSATVHVEIGKVPGETNLANNSATYQVFFSLGSSG
jgi:CARDB